jgi:uncharacterized protein
VRRFVLILYVATALLHLPFVLAATAVLARLGVPLAPLFALALAATLVSLLRGRIRLLSHDRPRPWWRMLLLEEPYFVHWCAAIASGPLFVIGLIGSYVISALRGVVAPSVLDVAVGAYAVGLLLAFWSVVIRRRWVRVRTVDVPIVGLAKAFEGYRIAHLSDLHIGSFSPRGRADRWVRQANAQGADLVALTGDYVTSGVLFHDDIAGALSGLRARDGVVAVMGNHDYFGDGEPLVTLLRAAGVEVLRNQNRPLERDGEALTLAGTDDVWTKRANVTQTLAGAPADRPTIVLAHDPKLFPALAKRGVSLVLSGHTHWGQVAMPFLATRYNLSSRSFRHHADVYRENGAILHVHPGLGTTGPPVRLGAPPEITVMRLRCA